MILVTCDGRSVAGNLIRRGVGGVVVECLLHVHEICHTIKVVSVLVLLDAFRQFHSLSISVAFVHMLSLYFVAFQQVSFMVCCAFFWKIKTRTAFLWSVRSTDRSRKKTKMYTLN